MTAHPQVKAERVENWDALKVPGQFCFSTTVSGLVRYFQYKCPCGDGGYGSIPIYKVVLGPLGENGEVTYLVNEPKPCTPAWQWDGNENTPTLTPSIRRLDGCCWHGFLTNGVWNPCGDSGNKE